DVVLGLGDRAERGQALVLADRRQLVAAAGQDLVRVGLVADVPDQLVARRIEQRVQRDSELARAEGGAEVPADRPGPVDEVLAAPLRDLDELLVAAIVQVLGPVDRGQESGGRHAVRVRMKSVIWRSSGASAPAASARVSTARP